jgi:hypothetical protein
MLRQYKPNNMNQLPMKEFIAKYFSFEQDGTQYFLVNPLKQKGTNDKGKPMFIGCCASMKRENFIELEATGRVKDKCPKKDKRGEFYDYTLKTTFDKADAYEIIFRHTDDHIICIDVDGYKESADIKSVEEFLALETTPEFFKTLPYTVSRTKNLPHFFVKLEGVDTATLNNTYEDCFKICHGDLLVNHSWEKPDAIVYNFDGDLPTIQWSTIKELADETKKYGEILLKSDKVKKVKKSEPKAAGVCLSSEGKVTAKNRELFDIIKVPTKPLDTSKIDAHRHEVRRLADCMIKHGFSEKDWKDFCDRNKIFWDPEKAGFFCRLRGDTDIYYAQSYAKRTNPHDYQKWQMKYSTYLSPCVMNKGENDVAQFISPLLAPILKYTAQGKWWYFNEKTRLWISKKHFTAVVVTTIQKLIDETRSVNAFRISNFQKTGDEQLDEAAMAKLVMESKIIEKKYQYYTGSSVSNQINKLLEHYLFDEKFEETLDINIGQLAFKNGMYDLKTRQFREGIQYDDFITKTIDYDYVPSSFEYIKGVLKKILNNNDEHLEYFLSLVGYAFTGDSDKEKDIYFMIDKTLNGKGDNGKTFFFDILNDLFSNYVYRSDSSLLEEKNTKKHKQMVNTKGMRLVWLEEFPKDSNTDAKILKQIADGKKFENEIMYGTSEQLRILFKMFVLSNHIPKIDPDESAVFNRYKQVSYNSHFDRTGTRQVEDPNKLLFIADKKLSATIKEQYFNEVFNIVIEYASRYYENGLPPIPQQFKKDTVDTQNKNDEFGLWFLDNIEPIPNARLAEKVLIDRCGMMQKEIREGMKRKGFVYNKELKGMGKDANEVYYKGGYLGVAFKVLQEDSDEEFLMTNCVIPTKGK